MVGPGTPVCEFMTPSISKELGGLFVNAIPVAGEVKRRHPQRSGSKYSPGIHTEVDFCLLSVAGEVTRHQNSSVVVFAAS